MSVWALGDLHLAISIPSKTMEVFGEGWKDYQNRIKRNWEACVSPDDLVLLPGDICWAMHLDQAVQDLEWIHQLPGTKVMIRGNHDYWWSSNSKMNKVMPESIHFIHNNTFNWKDLTIGGARLWDTPEFNFNGFIETVENPRAREKPARDPEEERVQAEKIFVRELQRLEMSLQKLDPKAKTRIAMVHYPPLSADLQDSRASEILERYKIDICVFGHLHSVRPQSLPYGTKSGVRYVLTSADYVDCTPVKII